VTETTGPDGAAPNSHAPHHHFRISRRDWLRSLGFLVFFLVIAIAGFTVGRRAASNEVDAVKDSAAKLREQINILDKKNKEQATSIADLEAKLKIAEDQLGEIYRTARTLEIGANESKLISINQLTIGLVGTPRNESVELNINGKQQSAAAGDVISVEYATNCRLQVGSLNVLKSSVVINRSCESVKP
jgi:hypothetical protein